jgi:hypothetical protein
MARISTIVTAGGRRALCSIEVDILTFLCYTVVCSEKFINQSRIVSGNEGEVKWQNASHVNSQMWLKKLKLN